MVSYLLDANHATRLMAHNEPPNVRVREAWTGGDRFGLSITVLAELYYVTAAEEFGRIQAEQKAMGRPIPPLDAQIATVARTHDLVVLTSDRHFRFVSGLTVQNWQS